MKYYLKIFFSMMCLMVMPACFSLRESKPKDSSSSTRLDIPSHGIVIEAKYDPRLDNLVAGYKIITLGLTNQGVDVLKLNPMKDRWEIVDAYGKTQKGIHSLRISEPQVWTGLPERMKNLIEYPVAVSMGYSETIDLFFPEAIDLSGFRSISFYSAEKKQEYDVLTSLGTPEDSTKEEAPQNSNVPKRKK